MTRSMLEKRRVNNKKHAELKSKILGMPFGTAAARLRKAILFHLASECNKNTCYRCQKTIDSVDEFSIDHKQNWQYGTNPIDLFFDVNNIAFSHYSCNAAASTKPPRRHATPLDKWRFKNARSKETGAHAKKMSNRREKRRRERESKSTQFPLPA